MIFPALLAWTPSLPELVVVCVVFILLFGAKKLPELSRSLGRSISEFKKGREEAERELDSIRGKSKSTDGDKEQRP